MTKTLPFIALVALAALVELAACGGSGSPSSTPTTMPTITPTAAVHTSPAALTFTGTGSSNAQTIAVSETGYSGTFTPAGCTGIASTTATTSAQFTITPIAAGTCTLTIKGAAATPASVAISITNSGFSVQSVNGGRR